MLGMGCRAPVTAFGEISPNDSATPTITSTTRMIDVPPANAITIKQAARAVENVRPMVIEWTH